jgi:hypothetical protein
LRRKRLHAPQWVWLLAAVALVAGGVVVALNVNSDDDKADVSSETTEDDSADTTVEATSLSVTDSVVSETTEPPATTEATDEPTTAETTPPASSEVAGSPPGVTGDRASPVPAGAVADIGGGWRLQILNVNPDAAAAIAAENQFNTPPPAGSTLTLITVALGYFGLEDPKTAFETTISAVGGANVELAAECGVVPQELDSFGQLFSGAVIVGNVCFVTTPQDASTLQLYASGDLFGGDEVFIDASAAPTGAVTMVPLTGPQPGATSTPGRLAPTPVGVAAPIGEGWRLAVSGAARDITELVMADNEFNEPPPDGFRFIGVDVTYAYDGEGSASAFSVTANAVGDSNLALSTQCGVTPGEMDMTADIFSGGTVSGTLCFVAPATSPTLVLYATADFLASSVMFATS